PPNPSRRRTKSWRRTSKRRRRSWQRRPRARRNPSRQQPAPYRPLAPPPTRDTKPCVGLKAGHAGPEPMEEFHRIRRLPPYVFEQVNRAKAIARNAGADIIDLGMGNPDLPAPAHVIEKLKDTLGKPRTDRYSASKGIAGLRRAQAAYYGRRFGVK